MLGDLLQGQSMDRASTALNRLDWALDTLMLKGVCPPLGTLLQVTTIPALDLPLALRADILKRAGKFANSKLT